MSESLARLTSALAGRYRIEGELGQGGMATVYLAEDLKHRRRVAVKVLHPELAAAVGSERFLREIEVAARLQHPNILGLLDSGQADGVFYYVMPFVEGETLRHRLVRSGELPLQDAVRFMAEIADALSVAHRAGVVHRDIKPENVLLSGRHAILMDFGVAKAVTESSGAQLTTAGVALGTPAYMAPEQATGEANLDGRVDLYALGVMGYEMLTGQTPFQGLGAQQMLAAQVTRTPQPAREHRPELPPALENIVMRCLQKRPADRYQTAEELLAALEPLAASSGGMTPTHTRSLAGWPRPTRWLVPATVLLFVLGALLLRPGTERAPISIVRTTRLTSAPGLEILPAISPDGKFIAYSERSDSRSLTKIYLQPSDGGRAIAITDSMPGDQESADWSPDGTRLAFVSLHLESNGLRRGEANIVLMPPTGGNGFVVFRSQGGIPPLAPRWSPDGKRIAFEKNDSVLIINADGTGLRLVARVYAPHSLARSPDGSWLAGVRDNREFLYSPGAFGNLAASTVFVVPAAGGTPRMVSDSTTLNISPVWLRDGSGLLYISSGGGGRDIYEERIGRDGRARGPARRITTGLDAQTIALSRDGRRLVYSKYSRDLNIWMVKVPPNGHATEREAVPVTRGNQAVEVVKLSPDGKWLAHDSDLDGNANIFVVGAAGGTPRQLTDDPADDMWPDWSPDGNELAFTSIRNGNRDIYTIHPDGTGLQRVTSDTVGERAPVWGTNNSLCYDRMDNDRERPVEIRRAGPGAPWGKPRELAPADGACASAVPGKSAYLFPAGNLAPVVSVPSDGGTPTPVMPPSGPARAVWPQLSRDGKTLYFMATDSIGSYIGAADLARGAVRKVVTFDPAGRRPMRFDFSTDGTRFYFVLGTHEADIWIAEVATR